MNIVQRFTSMNALSEKVTYGIVNVVDLKNIYQDSKLAHRHKRSYHKIKFSNESPADDIDFLIDEIDEVNFGANDNFFFNLEDDFQNMKFFIRH